LFVAPYCAFPPANATGKAKSSGRARPSLAPGHGPWSQAGGKAVEKKPTKRKRPAKSTRAKAAQPDAPARPDALTNLFNSAIKKGPARIGSGTNKSRDLWSPRG
jgi:hypothetical protein